MGIVYYCNSFVTQLLSFQKLLGGGGGGGGGSGGRCPPVSATD
jgi:hypothetical protein